MDKTKGTCVDASSRIVGELLSDADVRIDGLFEGTIRTAGSLTIGSEGEVRGDLFGADVFVDGKIVGDVHAAGHLTIGSTGILLGDITAGGLSIADGSTFRGQVEMSRDRGGDISQEIAPTGDPLGVDQEFDPTLITEALEVPMPRSLDSEDDEPPLWDTDEHRAAESRALMESAYTVPVDKDVVPTPDDFEPPPRRSIDQLNISRK